MNLCLETLSFEENTSFLVGQLVDVEGVEEGGVELLLSWILVVPTPISPAPSPAIDKPSLLFQKHQLTLTTAVEVCELRRR